MAELFADALSCLPKAIFQFLHPRAFQKTFSRRGIHEPRSEAVLHGQPLSHEFLKQGTVQ